MHHNYACGSPCRAGYRGLVLREFEFRGIGAFYTGWSEESSGFGASVSGCRSLRSSGFGLLGLGFTEALDSGICRVQGLGSRGLGFLGVLL